MPGIRTSEIIMLNFLARRTPSARLAGIGYDRRQALAARNEFSKLRWPGSSSTMRMRGAGSSFCSSFSRHGAIKA